MLVEAWIEHSNLNVKNKKCLLSEKIKIIFQDFNE